MKNNKLKNILMKASQAYYTDGSSKLSDAEFDAMLDEYQKENPDDELSAVGHGYSVAKDTTYGAKIKHKYGLVSSLSKCHNFAEFFRILKTTQSIYASLKLDGLSVVLYYTKGSLEYALTRGDGQIGIDVTSKVAKIDPSLLSIKDKEFTGAVRGEMLMSFTSFDKYKADHADAKNPRNTAAGLINAKEASTELELMDILVYNVVGSSELNSTFIHYDSLFSWLSDNFSCLAPMHEVKIAENTFLDTMNILNDEWYGIYPADGIVLTFNDIISQEANKTVQYLPNAVAFKFASEVKETIVRSVEWSLSKTKYLIPRVNFDTIELSGTNVNWAAGENAKNILQEKIGPGAHIRVTKANEIIPHILSTVVACDDIKLPETCPYCGSSLVWQGVHIACPNRDCGDAAIQDLLIWSENISPFLGLGDLLKIKFFNQLMGDDASIDTAYNTSYYLDANSNSKQYSDFLKMFSKMISPNVNSIPLNVAIKALNIPRLGDANSSKLAKYPEVIKSLMAGKFIEFTETQRKDIGPANCDAIIEYKYKFANLNYISNSIIWESNSSIERKGDIAITGKLSVARDKFNNELRSFGYNPVSSVNKNTLVLITDDPNSSSSKNKNADKFGIRKISEIDFRKEFMNENN